MKKQNLAITPGADRPICPGQCEQQAGRRQRIPCLLRLERATIASVGENTRAQAAVMLMRFCGYYADTKNNRFYLFQPLLLRGQSVP